jgi:hypothetical protein
MLLLPRQLAGQWQESVKLPDSRFIERREEILFRREVLIHRALGHLAGFDNPIERRILIAMPGKFFQRNGHYQRNSCGIELLDALTWHIMTPWGF